MEGFASQRRGHRRYQSIMAQTFSAELDTLFNMNGGLDALVSDVETKRQSVFVQQCELEDLEERIRQATIKLGTPSDASADGRNESEDEDSEQASNGAADALAALEGRPRANDKTPIPTRLPPPLPSALARSRSVRYSTPSIFAIRETEESPAPERAPPSVPISATPKRDFATVRRSRPQAAVGKKSGRVDSHIEVTTEEEEEDEELKSEDSRSDEEALR